MREAVPAVLLLLDLDVCSRCIPAIIYLHERTLSVLFFLIFSCCIIAKQIGGLVFFYSLERIPTTHIITAFGSVFLYVLSRSYVFVDVRGYVPLQEY